MSKDAKTPLTEVKTRTHPNSLEHKTYQVIAGKDDFLMIPCYMTFLVKTLKDMDVPKETLNCNATLIFRFRIHPNLPEAVKERIASRIELRIGEESFKLEKGKTDGLVCKSAEGGSLLIYTYRTSFDMTFESNLRNTPFDKFYSNLPIELTSDFIEVEGKQIKYRFNIHECDIKTSNLCFKEKFDRIPEFDVDTRNSTTRLEKEFKKINGVELYSYYPKVTYMICLVRQPYNLIASIIGPIFILQMLLLMVFAQANDVTGKVQSIAIIVLALLAYMPTIRSAMPLTPYFTLTDRFVYASLLMSLLCLFECVARYYVNYVIVTFALFLLTACIPVFNGLELANHFQSHIRYAWTLKKNAIEKVKTSSDKIDEEEWHNQFLREVVYPESEVNIKEL